VKFHRRPAVVEAHQWFKNGDHPEDDTRMIAGTDGVSFLSEGKVVRYCRPSVERWTLCAHCGQAMLKHGWIDVPVDGHVVCPGDWIIKEATGEFYPCRPEVFDVTYYEAEEA
jgi:hypothetical protein